jgi:hypothetical protein
MRNFTMRYAAGKKALLAAALLSACSLAQADGSTTSSDAVQFATQAGSVTGVAQACGQNTAEFSKRVNEAINKLAIAPMDRMDAVKAFSAASQQAQNSQMTTHPFACSQVIQDYNNLPILRPDYQQTVIAQLHPGMPNGNAVPPATSAPSSVPPNANANSAASPLAAPVVPPPPPLAPQNQPVQLEPQGSAALPAPNTMTTPPPSAPYDQGGLPGAQQQQMAPVNSSNNAAVVPSAPAASAPPPAAFNQPPNPNNMPNNAPAAAGQGQQNAAPSY